MTCQRIATVTQLAANTCFKQSTTYQQPSGVHKQDALRAQTTGFIRHFRVHIIVQKHLQSSTVTEYWNAIQGRISSPDSTLATPCERGLLMWPTVKSPEQYPCSSPHYFSLTLKRNSFTFSSSEVEDSMNLVNKQASPLIDT